jgi:hypothetical protein
MAKRIPILEARPLPLGQAVSKPLAAGLSVTGNNPSNPCISMRANIQLRADARLQCSFDRPAVNLTASWTRISKNQPGKNRL